MSQNTTYKKERKKKKAVWLPRRSKQNGKSCLHFYPSFLTAQIKAETWKKKITDSYIFINSLKRKELTENKRKKQNAITKNKAAEQKNRSKIRINSVCHDLSRFIVLLVLMPFVCTVELK